MAPIFLKKSKLFISAVILACVLGACSESADQQNDKDSGKNVSTTSTYKGKKILYLNSYHKGLPWSDGIEKGIHQVLDNVDVEINILRLDTKRKSSDDSKRAAALNAKNLIETYKPDVLITSDDNAFLYVVKEYYRDHELPVIFCGVNWNIEQYEGPYTNTAGMVEVVLFDKSINAVLPHAKGSRIGFLTEDTISEHSNAENLVNYVGINLDEVAFVSSFNEWKEKYLEMQNKVDILVLGVMGSYIDWEQESQHREIINFVMQNTKIPTVTEHVWMVEFTLLAYGKIPEEQGEWAAKAALQVLDGTPVKDIGVVKNRRGELAVNFTLAEKLGIVFEANVIKNAIAYE